MFIDEFEKELVSIDDDLYKGQDVIIELEDEVESVLDGMSQEEKIAWCDKIRDQLNTLMKRSENLALRAKYLFAFLEDQELKELER